ncbi:MAG TPA: META domain-containing protein [Candidatus Limnocylindria bacterium]|nr:META domain-containing protein [Candidatus Limnocylindria bacterium]
MLRLAPFLALVLVACGGGQGAAPASPSATAFDPTGAWELQRGTAGEAAIPIVEDHRITLEVTGSRIGGTAACNSYGGRLVARDGGLDIVELGTTAMACVDQGVMESEVAYVRALEAVDAMAMDGEELVLRGPAVELRFGRLHPPPTADLVGTTWRLETLVDGDVAAAAVGDPATLELTADGRLTGSTGCRGFDGSWIEQGDQIVATSLAMTDQVCPPALADQDNQVVTVIGDGFVPTIEGELLTLTDRGSVGLVYRSGD